MSDQPSSKSSAADAPKHFAIPSRPSAGSAAGQNASSWKIADQPTKPSPVPEREQAGASDRQPAYEAEQLSPHGQGSTGATSSPALREQRSPEQAGAATLPWSGGANQPGQAFASVSAPHSQRPGGQAFPPAPPSVQSARAPEPAFPRPHQPPPTFKNADTAGFRRLKPEGGSLPPLAPSSLKNPRLSQRYLYIALAIVAVVIVVGGLLSQQLLSGGSNGGVQNSALVFSGDGPYARLPLTSEQINAIQHLSGHMKYKALASLYVSHLSLDDEIGQLIMVEYNQERYSDDLDYMLHTLHVGGVIMYEFQMTSAKQTKDDIAHMQERANIPLIISTDEEGGPYVHRLSNIYGYRMSATQIEQTGSTAVASQQGLKTSKDLAALGINADLAPDVDVNQVNGYDMVTRTFGNTPAEVIKYASPYLKAMQGNGTIACIKHFPGLGGALTDAHKGLPVVHSSKEEIYNVDLAPFKAFIQSPDTLLNPGMIMPTDILLPAIDAKYPAELSYTFMTKILRQEFGYDGVTLTDALYMQGITNTWDMYTASVMALQAGNDMLLGANGTSQTLGVINAIKQALKDGSLSKARIDESATRIIALKMQYHLMPTYIPGA